MKKHAFLWFILFFTNLLFSQDYKYADELQFRVVEMKGSVDVKYREDEWKIPAVKDILPGGLEIFTGLHSRLSIEYGGGCYVTINQLSHVTINKIRIIKDEAFLELMLDFGYMVILSKPIEKYKKNKITIQCSCGNVDFEKSAGEVYMRKDKGAIIKAFSGSIKVLSKVLNIFALHKNEMCGITAEGILLESEYFLKRNISTKRGDIDNPQSVDAFYDFVFVPYSEDMGTNDYSKHFHP